MEVAPAPLTWAASSSTPIAPAQRVAACLMQLSSTKLPVDLAPQAPYYGMDGALESLARLGISRRRSTPPHRPQCNSAWSIRQRQQAHVRNRLLGQARQTDQRVAELRPATDLDLADWSVT